MPATSTPTIISASRRPPGTGTSSTWSGCSCSPASTCPGPAPPRGSGGGRSIGMSCGRYPATSPLTTGLACRCPRCGRGPLYKGYLTIAERCAVCGLDLGKADSGDGPAVFLIFILGAVAVGLAFVLQFVLVLPEWLTWTILV